MAEPGEYSKHVWVEGHDITAPRLNNIEDGIEANNQDLRDATEAGTGGELVRRDANGRAQVAAPSALADIARKAEVDGVQSNLDDHEANTTTAHGASQSATANSIARRRSGGRLDVGEPTEDENAATKEYVDVRTRQIFHLYTSSDTFVVPSGVDRIQVIVVGAGGAGGTGNCDLDEPSSANGGNGGDGGFGYGWMTVQEGDDIEISFGSSSVSAENSRTGGEIVATNGGDGGDAVVQPDPPGGVIEGDPGIDGVASVAGDDVYLLSRDGRVPGFGTGGAGQSVEVGPSETCDIVSPAGSGDPGAVIIAYP